MIRRSPFLRSLGTLFALWFSVFSTEPAALHACAMHSGHGVATAAMPAAMPAGMPAAHHHGGPAASEHAPAAPHESGAQCTCPGGCCAATSVAIPDVAAVFSVEVAEPTGRPVTTIVSVRATVVDFVLPFANGPPTV